MSARLIVVWSKKHAPVMATPSKERATAGRRGKDRLDMRERVTAWRATILIKPALPEIALAEKLSSDAVVTCLTVSAIRLIH